MTLAMAIKIINKNNYLTKEQKKHFKRKALLEKLINAPRWIIIAPFFLIGGIFLILGQMFDILMTVCDTIQECFREVWQGLNSKLYIPMTSKEETQTLVQAIKKENKKQCQIK